MSNIPKELRYTKSHEWVRQLAGGLVEIGISDHAQEALGDLVFAEVPQVGRSLKAGDAAAVVESVKAASDVYAPLAGEVTAANAALESQPELLNQEPYTGGWLFRLKTTGDTADGLMDAAAYAAFLAADAH